MDRRQKKMTFLDELKKDNPYMTEEEVVKLAEDALCPMDCGYEVDNEECDQNCEKCWNREMPNTEQHGEIKERLELIDELKQVEYNKGLSDAWELAKRILGIIDKENHELMPAKELIKIYGSNDLLDIFAFTPQEALAKLKAYEEAQEIKVGDVVKWENKYIIVTYFYNKERILKGVDCEGQIYSCLKENVTKTDKHIDIQQILDQIGE
jgi:hypothetical protein